MSQQSDTEKLPLSVLLRMDEVCNRFEDQWQAGQRPGPEPALESFPEVGRADLLAELLLVEWSYRAQRGETLSVEEYARRFGPWRAVVEQAWQRRAQQCLRQGLDGGPGAAAPAPSPREGPLTVSFLPGYEMHGLLGAGGMGEVHKAFDPRLKRWVALKRVRLDQVRPDRLARFRVEAEALARLAHPHIVKVHGYAESDGQPVLEMEYVAGGTLEKRLGQAPLAPAETARLVAILAWAVHAAHEKGIVHRDLKPVNVLMDAPVAGSPDNVLRGFPKISDFGLAALTDGDDAQTLSGVILGTPAYMSPEQAAGKTREVGPPTDVWALGVILYRCLTGALPFQGDSVLDTLERVKTMQMRPLREQRPEVPPELEEVCLACLRKGPGERPAAAELATRLNRLEDDGAPAVVTTELPLPRRRAWWVAAGLVAAGLVAASLLAVAACLVVGQRAPERAGRPEEDESPVVKLRVDQYDSHAVPIGVIGAGSFEAHYDDRVVLDVKLARRAHCFLIACNFDGKEQLLWPCDEKRFPHPGDPGRPPPAVDRFQYPPPPRPGPDGKLGKAKGIALNDDKAGGMQAFVVVAARRPLPAYTEWAKRRGALPWRRLPAAPGVWCSSGETLRPVTVDGVGRGQVVELEGQPPLLQLCGWAKGKDVEAVEALAFPVYRREGE
jgi:serine/threonine-protein kinase